MEVNFCCYGLVAKSYPIFCDPVDSSSPGSSVQGISQARILEWIVISFSRVSSEAKIQTSPALQADSSAAESSLCHLYL